MDCLCGMLGHISSETVSVQGLFRGRIHASMESTHE